MFDPNGKLESAVVNPGRFVAGVEAHFRDYVRELRRAGDSDAKSKFRAAVDLKWHLDGQERNIGMTEEEFYRAV